MIKKKMWGFCLFLASAAFLILPFSGVCAQEKETSKAAIHLNKTAFVYNGCEQKPAVTVTVDGEDTVADISYSGDCIDVGSYTATATLTGDPSVSASADFEVLPPATQISSLTARKNALVVKWKKESLASDGYDIVLAENKAFTSGCTSYRTDDAKTLSHKFTKLEAGKRYYLRIRTYKEVDKNLYYSDWSETSSKEAAYLDASTIVAADWASGNRVSVRFTKSSGASGYLLYRSGKENGTYKKIANLKGNDNLRALVKEKRSRVGYYKVVPYKTIAKKNVKGPGSAIFKCVKYKDSNLGQLFPSGPPTSFCKARPYLTTVRLKIRTANGGTDYITKTVHKKIAKPLQACFEDMYKIGFKVRSSDTGTYNWRWMRSVRLISHHGYGCAIDLNTSANPMVSLSRIGHCAYKPGRNSYSVTKEVVKIWKSHGFSWGGDWTEKKDYMHFSFTNC